MELLNLQSSLQSEIQAKAAISEELSRTRADLIAAQKYVPKYSLFKHTIFFSVFCCWCFYNLINGKNENDFTEIYVKRDKNGTQWVVKLNARIIKSANYNKGWKLMKAVSVVF